MDTVTLQTRFFPGSEADFGRIHAVAHPDPDTAPCQAGAWNWRIRRQDQNPFQLVEREVRFAWTLPVVPVDGGEVS